MVIIGLLIGGALKGQELVRNAQVTATVTQIRGYDTATTTFSDLYDELPGTMRSPGGRIPNCSGIAACVPTGDANNEHLDNGFDVDPVIGHERVAYFLHLAKADFIGGINEVSGLVFTGLFPEAQIKGAGFHAGYTEGGVAPAGLPHIISDKVVSTGHYLALHASTTSAAAIHLVDSPVLIPNVAARIDMKMDDGSAVTGRVLAFGDDSAGNSQCAGTNGAYAEANGDLLCGLYIRTPR